MAKSHIHEVILTETTAGDGSKGNPYRGVMEYFEKDGTLLFKKDSYMDELRERILARHLTECPTSAQMKAEEEQHIGLTGSS